MKQRCEKRLSCGHRCPSLCGEVCPNQSYCQECGLEKNKDQLVDVVNLSTYQDHDVDQDPILVLKCGHFFSLSTLDGCLGIHEVYEMNDTGDEFTGLKPLRGITISEKPKQCPECRFPIHDLFRYGRMLRLVELRCLERKHMALISRDLRRIADIIEGKRVTQATVDQIKRLETKIRKSPMTVVFEACGGTGGVERTPPPAAQLIHCLDLKGRAYECLYERIKTRKCVLDARKAYKEAIQVADESTSTRSGGQLRLALARLTVNRCENLDDVRDEVNVLLNEILELPVQFPDLMEEAKELQNKLSREMTIDALREVMRAVRDVDGYDYGGSASAHWYECPNGHPYFIGDCGGAMQMARCLECRAPIGGRSHQLAAGNTGISGVFRAALR
jgi:hypothetical protein